VNIEFDSETGSVKPWFVRRFEMRLSTDELDSLAVTILIGSDGNAAELKKIMPGQKFRLKLDKLKFEGDFVQLSFHHTSEGIEVTAYGLEALHRLRHQRLSEIKEQTRDKMVTTLLTAASVKRKSVGRAKPVAAEQVALDDDSVKLLKQLCVERNFVLYWSAGTLTYGPRNVSSGGAMVKVHSSELSDLQLDFDLSQVVTSVTMHGRDYRKDGKPLKFTASGSKLKKISKGLPATTLRLQGFGKLEHELPWSLGTSTASALEETAVANLQARAETFARGSCTGEWNLALKPLCVVLFENVCWPLTGPFLVSAVTHQFEDGVAETIAEFFSDSLPRG
jgi:hypothetical protein